MIIQHNILSINANRQLGINTKETRKNVEKLSSGYRINRAADDASGLAISEKLRTQVRGLKRASLNCTDGISLVRTADGALSQVDDILQRMRELSVQAANDAIYNTDDLEKIQLEVECLVDEIDRISDETEFNKKKLFNGGVNYILDPDGNPIDISSIPISDFTLSDVSLGERPIYGTGDRQSLNLTAALNSDYTTTHNTSLNSWSLIYGRGSTSHSGVQITYEDGGNTVTDNCSLENMVCHDYTYDSATSTYQRVFTYTNANPDVKLDITQTIQVGPNNGENQFYTISYNVANAGTVDTKVNFMFNADTAYDNNDTCEGYYIDGTQISQTALYTSNSEYLASANGKGNDLTAAPTSFSITNKDNALPFSEKIDWSGSMPSTILFGLYGQSHLWENFEGSRLSNMLGINTNRRDLAFTLMWENDITAGTDFGVSIKYGIQNTATDNNLDGVPITMNTTNAVPSDTNLLWVQAGANAMEGFYITIDKMNAHTLGIDTISVESHTAASNAISKVDDALNNIAVSRSKLGAQQNRLEYAYRVDTNGEENTQAAESRIRDTDMADEFTEYSKNNILQQSAQAMLSQANNSNQMVVSLLQ